MGDLFATVLPLAAGAAVSPTILTFQLLAGQRVAAPEWNHWTFRERRP